MVSEDQLYERVKTKIASSSSVDAPEFVNPVEWQTEWIDDVFSLPDVVAMVQRLLTLSLDDTHKARQEWAQHTRTILLQKSPLMLHVTLAQIRRARAMTLADELRMERDMMRHCFDTRHLGRRGVSSETVEGIRALVIDKDKSPQWSPASVQEVTDEMVQGFFTIPWPHAVHPLVNLI
jgi:enoyl-CoA hydratase/carnithine racemase